MHSSLETLTEAASCPGQLWHLLPAIHVGSFRSSFAERQDESDPVFLAVILAVVGAAMVAMPKAWLPIEYGKIRRTLEACVDLSTGIILSMEELPPNTTTSESTVGTIHPH